MSEIIQSLTKALQVSSATKDLANRPDKKFDHDAFEEFLKHFPTENNIGRRKIPILISVIQYFERYEDEINSGIKKTDLIKYLVKKDTTCLEGIYYDEDRNEDVIITTALHEAILNNDPSLVEILCECGMDVNLNPVKKLPRKESLSLMGIKDRMTSDSNSESDEEDFSFSSRNRHKKTKKRVYSFKPLDFALLHPRPNRETKTLHNPQIINILLKHKARTWNGVLPKKVTKADLDYLYSTLFPVIFKGIRKAQEEGKLFLLMLPESHRSKFSLLIETVSLFIAKYFNIKNVYFETDERSLQCKRRTGSFPFRRNTRESAKKLGFFMTIDALFNCEKIGMKVIAADISPSALHDSSSTDHMQERDNAMLKVLFDHGEHGVLISGANHIENLLYRINEKHEKECVVITINATPEYKYRYYDGDEYVDKAREIFQLPCRLEGVAEMSTSEEILQAARLGYERFIQDAKLFEMDVAIRTLKKRTKQEKLTQTVNASPAERKEKFDKPEEITTPTSELRQYGASIKSLSGIGLATAVKFAEKNAAHVIV